MKTDTYKLLIVLGAGEMAVSPVPFADRLGATAPQMRKHRGRDIGPILAGASAPSATGSKIFAGADHYEAIIEKVTTPAGTAMKQSTASASRAEILGPRWGGAGGGIFEAAPGPMETPHFLRHWSSDRHVPQQKPWLSIMTPPHAVRE